MEERALWLLLHRRPTGVPGAEQLHCGKTARCRWTLNSAWGLPDGQTWDLYRWYPDPARLQGERRRRSARRPPSPCGRLRSCCWRLCRTGNRLRLNRNFESKTDSRSVFAEPTRPIDISIDQKLRRKRVEVDRSVDRPGASRDHVCRRGHVEQAEGQLDSCRRQESVVRYLHHQGQHRLDRHHGDPAGGDDGSEPALLGPRPGKQRQLRVNEFCVKAWPRDNPAAAAPVALHNPVADFSQDGFGSRRGIDGNPRQAGLSIPGRVGRMRRFSTRNSPSALPAAQR